MVRKSGDRSSEKIMLKQNDNARAWFNSVESGSSSATRFSSIIDSPELQRLLICGWPIKFEKPLIFVGEAMALIAAIDLLDLDSLSPADAADLKKAFQDKKRELAKAMRAVDRGIAKLAKGPRR